MPENVEYVNVEIDHTLLEGNIYHLLEYPTEEFEDLIAFSTTDELVGSNVNEFFPDKEGAYDLIISYADKNNVTIKTIPLN